MMIQTGSARRRRVQTGPAAVVVLLAALVCGAVFSVGPPARAAVSQYTVNFGGWVVGGFVSSNGQLVYCVEPGAFEPVGAQQAPVRATTLPGFSAQQSDGTGWNGAVAGTPVSGDALRRMNWLLTTYGQTTNPDVAVAVQFAVWFLREDPGANDWLVHHVLWVQAHGGTWHTDRAYGMVTEAYAAVDATEPIGPDAPLSIAVGGEFGTGTVAYPAGTTRLDLTGAVFDGGVSSLDVGPEAGAAAWRTEMHGSGWESSRSVSVTGEWEREVLEWPAAVMLHTATVPGQQGLGSMVGPVHAKRQSALEPASVEIRAQFRPMLTTQAETPFVQAGRDRFADRVTFVLAEGSTAPWPARRTQDDGVEYAPVVANGVLYGPFASPPAAGEEPPEQAPVAARAEIVADRGPGEYLAVADTAPSEAGYYSWVWTIEESQQPADIRASGLLPVDYRFADRFGLAAEGQVVPMALRWRTELQGREPALDAMELQDRVTVSLEAGEWMRDADDVPLLARLRLTAYAVESEPSRSPSVPEGARELSRVFVEVDAAGSVTAPPIALPFSERGWVTVQTCLLAEDQGEATLGYVEEWCDDFGVPEETARISIPQVRTEAQPEAVVGGTLRDTAIVEGRVPEGADLGFVYYLQPEADEPKYDESWEPVRDENGGIVRWSAAELAALSEKDRCSAQPVGATSRVPVLGEGRVESPAIIAKSRGVGYWVEDLAMPHPETGEPAELHRGACGLENERTVISVAAVDSARLPQTGARFGPELLLLATVPAAGIGLLLAAAARRRRMQQLCSSRK